MSTEEHGPESGGIHEIDDGTTARYIAILIGGMVLMTIVLMVGVNLAF